MSSTHYYIGRDSINAFGNENSTSANYILSDTGGEVWGGYGESASYILHSGFRQYDNYKMELNCEKENVTLTPLRLTGKSNLKNNYINCNIITDNPTGYVFR